MGLHLYNAFLVFQPLKAFFILLRAANVLIGGLYQLSHIGKSPHTKYVGLTHIFVFWCKTAKILNRNTIKQQQSTTSEFHSLPKNQSWCNLQFRHLACAVMQNKLKWMLQWNIWMCIKHERGEHPHSVTDSSMKWDSYLPTLFVFTELRKMGITCTLMPLGINTITATGGDIRCQL